MDVATEQAFSLNFSELSVRHLPPAHTSRLLTALLRTNEAADSAGSDSALTLAPSTSLQSVVEPIPPLLAPLSAQLTTCVLLRTAPVDVPWVTATLKIGTLALSLAESQLVSITSLALATGNVLEPHALPQMPPPLENDGKEGTADAKAADAAAARSGWFLISERRSFEGRSEVTVLGTCWAFLELGFLVYETPNDGQGGSTRRDLQLKEWHLRGGSTADMFELASEVTAVGVRYSVVVTMQAASRSAATRFLSACASMQMHTRAEAPLPQRYEATNSAPGASEKQLRLRVHAQIEGIALALLAPPADGLEFPSVAAPPLACGRFGSLSSSLDYRKRDIRVTSRLQSVEAKLTVPDDSNRATTDTPRADVLVPVIHVGRTADAAVELSILVASQGSPSFDASSAQICMRAFLGDVHLHLCGTALHAIGSLTLRTHYQLSQAMSAVQKAHTVPTAQWSAQKADSHAAALQTVEPIAPLSAISAENRGDDQVGGRDGAADRPLLRIDAVADRLVVLLHEAAASDASGQDYANASALANVRLEQLDSTLSVGIDSMQLTASLRGLGLAANDGKQSVAQELLVILPTPAESGDSPSEATDGDQGRERSVSRRASEQSISAVEVEVSLVGEVEGEALETELVLPAPLPPLCTFRLHTWDEASPSHPGFDSDLALELMPLRALLPSLTIRRIQQCVEEILASVQGTVDMLGDQISQAASAAVSQAARAAAQSDGAGAKLHISIHGPLLVLPSTAVNGGALLLRLGDVTLSNSFSGASEAAGSSSSPAPRQPKIISERVQLTLANASVLVASSSAALDDDYLPQDAFRHHWMLENLQVGLTVDRKLKPPEENRIDEVEAEDSVGSIPSSSEVRIALVLSAVDLSFASSELIFLAALGHETMDVFMQPADEPSLLAEPDTTPSHIDDMVLGGSSILAASASELSASTGSAKLVMHGTVNCEGGLRVAFTDDVDVGVLPLFELGLNSAVGGWMLVCERMPNGEVGEIEDANVQLSLEARASFFNATNGYWEPAIEPWRVSTGLNLSRAQDQAGGKIDDETITEGLENDTEQPSSRAASKRRMVPELTLMVTSLESFEVNVSPVLISAAHAASLTVDKVTRLISGLGEAGQRGGTTQRNLGASMNARLLGLRNRTELPITLSLASGGAHHVHAGADETIADVSSGPVDDRGQRSMGAADTTDCVELVKAARAGDATLVAELLRRFANPNSMHAEKHRTALHAAAKHKRTRIVRMLVQASADVEQPMTDGSAMRPLHLAAASGSMRSVRLLLDARADPSAPNADGQNAAGVAYGRDIQAFLYEQLSSRASDSGRRFPSAALVLASSRGDNDRAFALLRSGADPNSSDAQLTALASACAERQHGLVTLLLQSGAEINRVSPSGVTALHCAARAGPKHLVKALLDAKADVMAAHASEGTLPVDCISNFRTQEAWGVHELLCNSTFLAAPIAGWLTKLGGERKTWKPRYCVLTSCSPSTGQLRYYADETMSYLHGAVDLRGLLPDHLTSPSTSVDLRAHIAEGPLGATVYSFDLKHAAEDRTYTFYSEEEKELWRWLDMLRLLFVRSYTRNLDEVETPAQLGRASSANSVSSDSARSSLSSFTRRGGNVFTRTLFGQTARRTDADVQAEISRALTDESGEAGDAASDAHAMLTLTVGDDAMAYAPLDGLSMRSLGARLHMLTPASGSPVGMVAEIAYISGRRTLTVRSSVSISNETEIEIEMGPQHPPSAAVAASCTSVVPAGATHTLPLLLTDRGSEAAIWDVKLRPILSGDGSAANAPSLGAVGATLLPPTLFSKDAAIIGSNDALLVCPSLNPESKPWACCAAIEFETLGFVASTGPVNERGRRGRGSNSRSRDRQWRSDVLRRYNLPATETLLAQFSCHVPHLTGSGTARGELNATRHFVCWGPRQGHGQDALLMWSKVEALGPSTAVHEAIEFILVDGTKLAFSGFVEARRDDALRTLREIHSRARSELTTGEARWLPLTLRLFAPLTVTNLLPCTLRVLVAPIEMEVNVAKTMGWPVLPSAMNPQGSDSTRARGGESAESIGGADDDVDGAMVLVLPSGRRAALHDVATLGPIRIIVEEVTANGESGRRGELLMPKPSDRTKGEKVMALHARASRGGAPAKGVSSHALQLVCTLQAGKAGSLGLSLQASTWLRNHSSLPLRLFDASFTSDFKPVAEAMPHAHEGVPFSLSDGGGMRNTTCRIGIAQHLLPGQAPPSARPVVGDYQMQIHDGRLSRPLAPLTGTEGVVEVTIAESGGSVAELVVQLSPAGGALEKSGATVMHVYNRFVLHNKSQVQLEWRQALPPPKQATEASSSSLEDVATARAMPAAHELSPGARAAVYWSGAKESTRTLTLRCNKGWRTFDWCAPFSPTAVGELILKLRPSVESASSGGRAGSQLALYLRLTVSMKGSRRYICIRSATDGEGRLRLPHRISNRSSVLLAFCQRGCEESEEHWDLLGAGESADYTWDRPSGEREIVVAARDTTGVWSTPRLSPSVRAGGRYDIDKVGASLSDLRLEPRASGTEAASRPRGASSVLVSASLADDDAVLLSASCSLWCGGAVYAKGWLCLTQGVVTFIPFSAAQAAAAGAANSAHARTVSAVSQAAPLPLTELPLSLAEVTSVDIRPPSELVIGCRNGKQTLVIASLRAAERTLSRIRAVLSSREALAKAAETLTVVREHLAGKAGRKWLSKIRRAPPVAASNAAASSLSTEAASTRIQAQHRARQARRHFSSLGAESLASAGPETVSRPVGTAGASTIPAGGSTGPRSVLAMSSLRMSRFPSTELIEAARLGEVARVSELLSSRADPDTVDWRGMCAMHVCCATDRAASLVILAELLAAGADVEQPTRDRWRLRPLHVAARLPNGTATARALIHFGASPLANSADGKRPHETASRDSQCAKDLAAAAAVWEAAAGPWVPRAALVSAIGRGRLMRASELLVRRTSPNSTDKHGLTALHVACACADAAAVQMLLQAGAEVNRVARDGTGRRALHVAAAVGASRCARLLLESRADPVLADEEHRLPLDYCRERDQNVRALLMRELLRVRSSEVNTTSATPAGSAQSSAPALVLSASVHSRGPVKELLFDEASQVASNETARVPHPMGRGGSGGSDLGDSGGLEAGSAVPTPTFRLEASFATLGLTLVDEEPAEVVRLALQNLIMRSSRTSRDHSVELKVGHLQVDACVSQTRHPVMLSPTLSQSMEDSENSECLHISLSQDLRWAPVPYINYVGAALQPLRLEIEQNTVARLVRMLSTIEAEWKRTDEAQAAIQARAAAAGAPAPTAAASSSSAGDDAGLLDDAARGGGEGDAVEMEEWSVVALESESVVLHIREMHLEPVRLTATISIAPICDEHHMQEFHPTNSMRSGLLKQLTSLQNVSLTLDAVEFTECAEEFRSLVQRLQWKYSMEIIQQLHKLVGSLDLLGNPAALFADVRGGVKTFFREPQRGTLKGVVKGTGGLVGGVLGGGVSAATSMFSAGFRVNVIALSNLSGDAQYAHRRQLAQQQKALSMKQGLRMGAEAMRDGVASGLTGLVKAPVRGARQSGASGAVRGVGLGLAGLIAKPLSGVAGFASKVTEGIGSEAKKVVVATQEVGGAGPVLRLRQPRLLADGVLRPYQRSPPAVVLNEAEDEKD